MAHDDDAVNDWDLGSGLDLDGAKVEITKCDFGFNNEIPGNPMCANMEFNSLDGDGEPMKQSFSVGKGWESDRTGENLVTEDGKKRKLNMQSNFGILLSSAMDMLAGPQQDGESDREFHVRRMEAAAEHLGSPRHAPNWVGTMWEMGSIVKQVMNPSTKVMKDANRWVFTAWLGTSPDSGAEKTEAKASGSKAGGTKTATKTGTSRVGGARGKVKADAIPDGIDEELWTQLVDLAVEVMGRDEDNEHQDFMNEAIENIDGVDGNRAASKACMGSKAGSVWFAAEAKVKADK